MCVLTQTPQNHFEQHESQLETHLNGTSENVFGNMGRSQFSHLFMIFYLLLSSMTVRQGTVLAQAKELNQNAALQNSLNKENGDIPFSALPPNAKESVIAYVQNKNQIYASEKENIQNALILARQVAQVSMTKTTTNVNLLQQDASEDSAWLKALNTVFKVIDEMSPAGKK